MNLLSYLSGFALAAEAGLNFHIDFDAFLQTLPMMLFGMLGIFIVIGAIMLGIKALFALYPTEEEKAKREKEKQAKNKE